MLFLCQIFIILDMKKTKYKNPVCVVIWQDAAFSYEKNIPKGLPLPQLTTGFVIKENKNFLNIATNVGFNKRTNLLELKDGFLIPRKTILKFKKIGYLNE